jgi:hypothetical protein
MSTPEPHHPIDPVSQALGRIEGRLDGLDKRLDERFAGVDKRLDELATKAELRAWSSLIVLLVGTLLALVFRGHGG